MDLIGPTSIKIPSPRRRYKPAVSVCFLGPRVSRADEAFIEEVIKEISASRAGSSGIATPRSGSSGTSTPAELNVPANSSSQAKSLPSPNRWVMGSRLWPDPSDCV